MSAGRKPWWLAAAGGVVAILVFVVIAFATGLFSGDSDSSAKPGESANPGEPAKPGEGAKLGEGERFAGSDLGSPQDPLPVGSVADMVEWDVSLGATNPDAWSEFSGKIAASERDSSAPKDGEAWVAVPIELTRTAEGSDTIYAVVWRFIAKSGVDYVDPCSYSLPDFVKSSTEVASGETISSKACVLVPEDEIEGGTWRVAIINSDYEKVAEAYFAMN